MNPDVILQAILAIGGGGVVAALINFVLTRPKIRAEAASIATSAADTMISRLQTENARLNTRIDDLEDDVHKHHGERQALEQWAWRVQRWIIRAYDELRSYGSQIEPPPELKLSDRNDHDR